MAQPLKELPDKQAAQAEALAAYLSKQQIADYLGVSKDATLESTGGKFNDQTT